MCIEAGPGEEGELVAKIIRGDPVKDFQGYGNNRDETEKKILRDVFRKGDAYFRSGDLVTMDKFGWIFFKDRCGDTFRSNFFSKLCFLAVHILWKFSIQFIFRCELRWS